jgi:hypothetical protein
MRRGLINQIIDLFRKGSSGDTAPSGTRTRGQRPTARTTRRPGEPMPPPSTGAAPARDIDANSVEFEYAPCIDGDPDPGEVVWTWVPYEEDPTQGKDRPVVILGRRGSNLAGVPLTSKPHDNEAQVAVGTGSWDREGRPSFAKVERLLEIDPEQVRREGAVISRARFDAVVTGVVQQQRSR